MTFFLSIKDNCKIEVVCKKWRKCVKLSLAKKHTLKLKFCRRVFKLKSIEFHTYYFIDNSNINILKVILTKYPNIKIIDLTQTIVSGKGNLMTIAKFCLKLEQINFQYSNLKVSKKEINKFAKIIGPQ